MWLAQRVAAALLLASSCVTGSNFVTSLHSNYVVNLDFDSSANALRALDSGSGAAGQGKGQEEGESKVMAFACGKRKFRCKLPNTKNRTRADSKSADAAKSKAHFIKAKLASLRGTCWHLPRGYWTYEVCFGRKIAQYRSDSGIHHSLGEHVQEADELLPSGGVRELYVGGTDNRTSEVNFICGSSEANARRFNVEETQPLYYVWNITGPTFCSWREADSSRARTADGAVLKVSALLEDLRRSCVNVTQGWWTYEYCYPRSLTQFHQEGNGKKRNPEHVLGTLNGTNALVEPDEVDMEMIRLKPSISPRERRAPPSNHRTLKQRLGGGTVCDETHRPRATTMHFQCPQNWQSKPATRIVSINEGSLCEYNIMVHTTLLCGHEKFLPTLPRGKETIQCVAEGDAA